MTDRERLATLVDEVRQILARIEQAGKDGAMAAMVERLHFQARAKMGELADLQAKLLDE